MKDEIVRYNYTDEDCEAVNSDYVNDEYSNYESNQINYNNTGYMNTLMKNINECDEDVLNYKFETENESDKLNLHNDIGYKNDYIEDKPLKSSIKPKKFDFFSTERSMAGGKVNSVPDLKPKQNLEEREINNYKKSVCTVIDNKFDLGKYKVIKPCDDSDIEVELEADSKQITDFNNSMNQSYIYKKNENEEYKIHNTKSMININEKVLNKEKNKNEEIKLIKKENYQLQLSIEELEEKLEMKEKQIIDYKNKNELLDKDLEFYKDKNIELKNQILKQQNELNEKDQYISNIKIDIQIHEGKINDLSQENISYKSQIENIKSEFNNFRNETNKKSERINEMQQKIFMLEQENHDLRNKSHPDHSVKQSLDSLKLSYMDLKNQYELLNIKYQNLNDDNFNLKRDLIFVEKELKNKNETVEKLKSELLIADNKDSQEFSYRNFPKRNDRNRKSVDYNKSLILDESNEIRKCNIALEKNESGYCSTKSDKREKTKIEGTIINILPSQKNIVNKENKILEIETELYSFQQEREKIRSEYSKLPEFPKNKAIILKKKNLELNLEDLTHKITKLKVELKNLNALNRDY